MKISEFFGGNLKQMFLVGLAVLGIYLRSEAQVKAIYGNQPEVVNNGDESNGSNSVG